jgi:hypothetical protein
MGVPNKNMLKTLKSVVVRLSVMEASRGSNSIR